MFESEIEPTSRSLFAVVQRRSMVAGFTFAVIAAGALGFVAMHKPDYAALSHVVLVNDPAGRDPTVIGVDMPTIATGSTVLSDVRKQLGLSESVNDLRRAVVARIAPRSTLMTIAVQDKNPQHAVAIDNAIADTFATNYSLMAGSRYDDVMRRLNVDVAAARTRLGVLDRRLEGAVAGASYVGSATSMDQSAQHLGELQEQRGVVLGQYVTDRTNLQSDLEQPRKTEKIVRYEILRNNAAYHEAETSVSKDVAQYTTTRAGVNASYPGIAGFNDKLVKEAQALDKLRTDALAGREAYSPSLAGQLAQTAKDEAAFKGDLTKLDAFNEQIRALKMSLSNPVTNAPSLGALRAERDTAEAQLQTLSVALSNAQTSSAQASSLGDVVVVDRATEARPTLQGPLTLFALGLIAALVLAIAAAYLAEMLVPRLLGSSDVQGVYGRPVLATLRAR